MACCRPETVDSRLAREHPVRSLTRSTQIDQRLYKLCRRDFAVRAGAALGMMATSTASFLTWGQKLGLMVILCQAGKLLTEGTDVKI